MYGKFEKSILLCIAVIVIIMFLAISCVSRRTGIDDNILSHQREIDRLEEELRNRDRAVENAVRELEAITSRSTKMEGTIDEVIYLFGEYQRRVEQLIHDYNTIRAETEN